MEHPTIAVAVRARRDNHRPVRFIGASPFWLLVVFHDYLSIETPTA
nr:hypothetical protein [Pseudomonas putida]